ncbi:hypothetical protein SERLA73DRAFT_69101 [Serpula lacrymans var. lacrymans S7.3]|uniref:Cytochrome P450 n=2 Tax=Serpula lacrymans var. lacrymans TaxID=341189 RepID=F8PJ32_SERL3|nr:hypothetical protein SERLA73DRAFT_69101 [Serpula lacrymans var. lacrymans S7.3]
MAIIITLADATVVTLTVLFLAFVYQNRRKFTSTKYPPGPPGLPLVGCAFENPSSEKQPYKGWRELYGPISHFRLLTQDVFVLNTHRLAYELLDKRANTYADRPRQVMCAELISWNRAIALAPAGTRHRKYRKLVNSVLSPNATKRLWPVQEKSASAFVTTLFHQCVDKPSDAGQSHSGYEFLEVIRQVIGMHVVDIIYGPESIVEDESRGSGRQAVGLSKQNMEKYIHDADEAHALFAKALVPFAYIVDWIPWLQFLPESTPFVSFKKEARQARENLVKLTMFPYTKVRERIAMGLPQISYVDHCFTTTPDPTPEDEESIAWTAMSAYTGGSDTTIAAIKTAFFAASLHPEAQALAQSELDQIVGQERMPEINDRPNLPYVTAFVNECMRLIPVAPVAIPHRAMEDETIDEYFIPKGATIIPNIREMLRDPDIYESPLSFDPVRFLPTTGTPTHPDIKGRTELNIGSLPYGFGRRICPGMHLADSGVWLYVSTLLWAYHVSMVDDDGSIVKDRAAKWESAQFSSGAIQYPLPFKVKLVPRSSAVESLLRNA